MKPTGIVAHELIMVGIEELPPIAQAVELRRLVEPGGVSLGLAGLAPLATTILTAAHRAVRTAEPRGELAGLMAAEAALARLRRQAWRGYRADRLSKGEFDAVMIASGRCRQGLELARESARRRARRWIECPTQTTLPGWR
jgi:hypothetical protein